MRAMKQIMYPEWARWAHIACLGLSALISCKEKKCMEQTFKVCHFWTILVMELQKVAEGIQNKKRINNSSGFIVQLMQIAFLSRLLK